MGYVAGLQLMCADDKRPSNLRPQPSLFLKAIENRSKIGFVPATACTPRSCVRTAAFARTPKPGTMVNVAGDSKVAFGHDRLSPIRSGRRFYDSAFKLRVVRHALMLPENRRHKPAARCYPGVTPVRARAGTPPNGQPHAVQATPHNASRPCPAYSLVRFNAAVPGYPRSCKCASGSQTSRGSRRPWRSRSRRRRGPSLMPPPSSKGRQRCATRPRSLHP